MTEQDGHRPPPVGPRSAMQNTPNAERYVLEADAMRRRQLRSALLHGSRRTWREHRRVWPALVVGLIVVAVIVAALAVTEAFRKTEANEKKEQQQQDRTPSSAPATPGPKSSR
ncbi:ABC transporter permease [Aeromicrobium ginsengisoli]|uniref:ABC transporter permease n=1 Tax=Aeromicrobium ginsengisoli TaxID=363867 RepID=UPI00165F37F1|nr:ABC transporter permease [Aeromicrobium ginsengisoli]